MASIPSEWQDPDKTPIDFLVVGAGAGGAPMAARLAERGFQVLVVEMGPKKPRRLPDAVADSTEVPLLHTESTEDRRHSLRFFVEHFGGVNEERNPRLHKHNPDEIDAAHPEDEEGIFYPRAQGIGGCTIHNAMITICGPSEDWDDIADRTSDPSWAGEKMRAYFERLENCNYAKQSLLERLALLNRSQSWVSGRHGYDGWLETSLSTLKLLKEEKQFLKIVKNAALTSLDAGIETLAELKSAPLPSLDPNHWETMRKSQEGLARIPCAITKHGERSSPRERLLGVQKRLPELLHTLTGVLATKILFDADPSTAKGRKQKTTATAKTARGVQVLPVEHVYEADAQPIKPPSNWRSQTVDLFCKREVILCGGSFNTPQLLMLSGIGDDDQLTSHKIDKRHTLTAVGKNLQDRYEVPITAVMSERFKSLDELGLTALGKNDPLLREWIENRGQPPGTNVYASNGGLIGIFKRSRQEKYAPDLFIFALAGYFPGYEVGYSKPENLTPDLGGGSGPTGAAREKRFLTWLVLKARSRNDTGTVKLQSKSPFRRPKINFNVLKPLAGQDVNHDLEAIREGVEFVEDMLESAKAKGLIESYAFAKEPEDARPPRDSEDYPDFLREWIQNLAWGHHACGTCRMGKDPEKSVVDARFRVHGIHGLRVVDASVFPKIPGYFIVTNVYMISEKAADVLTEDHSDHFAAVSDQLADAKQVWSELEDDADDETRQAAAERLDEAQRLHDEIARNMAVAPVFRSQPQVRERQVYPAEVEEAEAQLVRQRRRAFAESEAGQ